MTPYQKRMTPFISSGTVYLVACPIALGYYSVSNVGWVIYASTVFLYLMLALGLDAVYDSLIENMKKPSRDGFEEGNI